jgi:tripartite-type tricarboxylate transporter receptor subunit TctC
LFALSPTSDARADWPERPVSVVVPYAAGGNTDIMARLASDALTQKLGQAFVVENKPGAGGAIATQFIASSPPDGYRLLFASTAQTSIVPYAQKIKYDPVKDLAPIAIFGQSFSVLAISAKTPAKDLNGFIAYAKANPGKVNYGSGGVGTVAHLISASLGLRAGVEMVHVPYKGGSQSVADLLSGQIDMYFGNSAEILPFATSDKIRLIAVGTLKRVKQLPDVPSVAEVLPGSSMPAWNGFLAPAGTPRAIIDLVSRETLAAAQLPTTSQKLFELGIEPGAASADEHAAIIRDEQGVYAAAVKAAGITPE